MSESDMNTHSSRSHTIFQIVIEQKSLFSNTENGTHLIQKSKLNVSGSEKWHPHKLNTFTDKRISEMTSINQSLSNLGNCVPLSERGRSHIPYRNSKLTRLLADSLGGNTKTIFIVTLSPASDSLEESTYMFYFFFYFLQFFFLVSYEILFFLKYF
eukprot:GSMAST32.ASY1.ANO1.1790.1 assembled CDS